MVVSGQVERPHPDQRDTTQISLVYQEGEIPERLSSLPGICENIHRGRLEHGLRVDSGDVRCKRSAPTRRHDSFSPSPGSPPPRDGSLGPQASRQVTHECGSRRSRRVGGPSPVAPLCWSRLFTPWYKCRPRPDRCRQFLRGRPPVLGALVLGWSIKGENILSFLCVLGLFRGFL